MIYKVASVPQYTGYSTETKPTDPGSVTAGSTFDEIDTGLRWIWTGLTWIQTAGTDAGALVPLRQAVEAAPLRIDLLILRELRRMREQDADYYGIPRANFEPLPELDPLGGL